MKKKAIYSIAAALVLLTGSGCSDGGRDNFIDVDSDKTVSCEITDLTVNYETNPIGIEHTPLFGWHMEDNSEGQRQTAYRIVVAASLQLLEDQEYVWDSGRIESEIAAAIPYQGSELEAGKGYVWKVCVWDKDGILSESSTASFELGLTDNDWSGASWIGLNKVRDKEQETDAKVYDYTIEYDVRLGRTCTGFVWGMDTNQYGEYFRCDFNTLGEEIAFSILECSNVNEKKDVVVLNEKFSNDKYPDNNFNEEFCSMVHHVKLDVEKTVVHASVDGTQILEMDLGSGKEPGNIGLWTARGAYYSYYDNICVTDSSNGYIIYEENFDSRDDNIFSPYYIKIMDGWCEASSGFLLTPGVEEPAPMLRYCFEKNNDSHILSARLYASALGDYRIYLNGNDVCGEYLTPGRSIYSKETYYRTYDVTEMLDQDQSENVIGAVLGHGRYDKSNANWGENIAFLAKLIIQYEDHTVQTIVTDDTWQVYADGPIRNDDMFLGEYYDASMEEPGWNECGYTADKWQQADVFHEYDTLEKSACEVPAVKNIETLVPVTISEPVKGEYLYDFGQNFNGNCQIVFENTAGKEGTVVIIRYAEALNRENLSCRDDEIGTIFTENLYTAENTDYYVMSGAGEETYTPSLVCRGFRYVQISGVDEAIPIEQVRGRVISTDNKKSGSFECSDEKMNRLYDSIYWTQLSNYLDVPTDCPQRDERFGWAGDIQVFARTAAYNANIHNYMAKYAAMLIEGQCENGAFPEIAPSVNMDSGANGWSDAGIILIWELYQQYGNKEIISENLDAMCRYMDYLVDTSDDFIRTQHNYSDHNAVAGLDDDIANTAQCAYVAGLLSKMSADIGENDIAKRYDLVYNQYKKAWQDHYINADGSIDCWLQSAYTLGLAYGLYPEELEAQGAACLNNAVLANDYHLNTGYIATQFLLPVLCRYGYVDTAYRILLQDTYPSWNHMLSYDQTTITEAWNTCYDTGEGTYAINGSLNHFALGSVGQWMYSDILGIRRDEQNPGYKHFYLEPQVGGGLTYVSGSYDSVYGTIESSWRIEDEELVFNFTIPANTTATVTLPDEQYQNIELGAGKYEYRIILSGRSL
ncbi:MAG: glycoside hydrolase family 78 protein [Lachnospiraceae bacterium]|nr:glycoside hydrolase family 78 protein [Lachnospiraceae bacterium]